MKRIADFKIELVYLLFFLMIVIFSGKILPRLNSRFENENLLNSVSYIVLLLIAIMIFHSEIISNIINFDIKKMKMLISIGFITFVFYVLAGIVLYIIGIESLNKNSVDAALSANHGSLLLLNLTIVFFAPITEELAYRFCIASVFPSNPIITGIISVLLFSFMHVFHYVLIQGNISQLVAMLPYMVLGTGLYILYLKSGNILYPIILHAAINFIAVIIK